MHNTVESLQENWRNLCFVGILSACILASCAGESGLMATTGGSYKRKYSNAKCSGGASADVTDIGGCQLQEAGLQAGQNFYSFNSNNIELGCITASSCDISVVAANTETYKQWISAYTHTHAKNDSAVALKCRLRFNLVLR